MENFFTSKVVVIGTSKGIVIPVPILKALGLERGDYIVFAVYRDGQFVARKLSPTEIENMKPREILMD